MCIQTPCFLPLYHKGQKKPSQLFLLFFTLLLSACDSVFPPRSVDGVVGSTDDRIALTGERVIQNGGNAADAMAAMLMTGSVVMPSRIGLGAGGVCQILDPSDGRVKTLDFLSKPMSFDGRIAIPSLPKGVFALQNKYGVKRWSEIFSDAISYADEGVAISDVLAKDIVHTQGLPTNWKNLKRKDTLKQPQLAKTLRILSSSGVGVLYTGDLADSIVTQSNQVVFEDLKNYKVSFMDSIDVSANGNKTFFANPSVLSAKGYTIWKGLQNSSRVKKQDEAKLALSELDEKIIDVENTVLGTSLVASDKSGLVVVCSVSMGSAFGSRKLTKEGFYLGKTIPREVRGDVFLNVLQTNPDVTDATYILSGVGDYALADGLSLMSGRIVDGNFSDERENARNSFISLMCEKGYPNDVQSCNFNSFVQKVFKKQDLTN